MTSAASQQRWFDDSMIRHLKNCKSALLINKLSKSGLLTQKSLLLLSKWDEFKATVNCLLTKQTCKWQKHRALEQTNGAGWHSNP
jgi:hypothetical protein